MHVINKLRRKILVLILKKRDLTKSALCVLLFYTQTLLITKLKIIIYYENSVWHDFDSLGRFSC